MSYSRHTWECGESITAGRLNNIEDGIEEAMSKGGYECTETSTLLTEETVTTVDEDGIYQGTLSYGSLIDSDIIRVTFDGVEYECPRLEGGGYYYGGFSEGDLDFSQYPFAIDGMNGDLATETAGTYSIKIEAVETTVHVDSCFRAAVMSGGSVSVPVAEVIEHPAPISVYNASIYNIAAKSMVQIPLTDGTGEMMPTPRAWGSIHRTNAILNLLVIPEQINDAQAYVVAYNPTDSSIQVDTGVITAEILVFGEDNTQACVLLGEGCDEGGGK